MQVGVTIAEAIILVGVVLWCAFFVVRALAIAWMVHRDRKVSLRDKIARENQRSLRDPKLYLRRLL